MGGYFFEIFMNANQRLEVVEPCRLITGSPVVVECTIHLFDGFHGPAGISGTAPAQFYLDDDLRITRWDDNQDCCLKQAAFTRDFWFWLLDAHRDVYDQIRPIDNGALPGYGGRDPADMSIAIQYVDEFVAQSDKYPLDLSNS